MEKVDAKKARASLDQRADERRCYLDSLWKKASDDADSIIAYIIKQYNPLRVWQWGSVLRKEHFSEISDIDVAVEKLGSAEDFFRLVGECQDMTDFDLDIVELDKIEPAFADLIKSQGKLRYERG